MVLPARADGALQIHNTASGASVEVLLEGALPAPAEVAEGLVIYRRAYRSGAAVIHRPADLRGKRVGVFKGSTAQFGLLMLMRQHGLQRHSLTTVFLTPEEQMAALKDRKIDAAMVWEPWMQRMIHNLGARLITTEGDLGV